jgi:TonB family protein
MPAVRLDQTRHPVAAPRLLVELPSWHRVFLGNLRDLVLPRRLPRLELRSAPAPFWPDVFVKRRLPWLGFVESGACHFLAFVLLVALTRLLALQPQSVPRPAFDHSQVVYYSALEYLPPLDTRTERAPEPKKADPEYSRQAIISVPPEADNRSQTIVTPPRVKLKGDVALPNIVAWPEKAGKPQLEIPAAPLIPAAEITRMAPRIESSVVAPPPDAARLAQRREQPNLESSVVAPPPDLRASRAAAALQAPQPAVVAPPPVVENAPARALGELNIGHTAVIAPAPQLPVNEQRAVPGGRSPAVVVGVPQVVPPPPSLSATGSAGEPVGSSGPLIALNLHPAVGAPPDPPPGNRRGTFAATPEGHPGASGTPGTSSADVADGAAGHGSRGESGMGSNRKATDGIPAGLYVGSAPASARTSPVAGDPAPSKPASRAVNPNLTASIPPPRVSSVPGRPMQPESTAKLSEAERAVFGNRRFYSLTLNMPNLNSAGGSWIVRFAELKQESDKHGSGYLDSKEREADLSQPSATRKVDPGYPLQLMRENVAGTVILYAVIRADGTVGNIRVLRGVDERLDRFACQAVAQWQFQPATRDGVPVDVEATFQIPFRPQRINF